MAEADAAGEPDGASTTNNAAVDESAVKQPDPFRLALLDEGKRFDLILVRHGQQGDRMVADSPLSDLGRQQAETVAEYLADEAITAVYSSQLLRAHDTGRAIAEQHGLDCIVDERLAEIQIGRDLPEGKKMRDLVPEAELKERAEQFIATRRWDTWAYTETGDELRGRVGESITEIRSQEHLGGVVVACHGGVINAIIGHELGVEMDYFFKVAHASVHRLRIGHDRLVIEAINDTRHLYGELLTY